MTPSSSSLWPRFQQYFLRYVGIGISLDISRMSFPEDFFVRMTLPAKVAVQNMLALEKGAIANPDEKRMVGHYWLRDPFRAPTAAIQREIVFTQESIQEFAKKVHSSAVVGSTGKKFTDLLCIGIGGSALGPQLVCDALWSPENPIQVHFFDNTDPDGFHRVLHSLEGRLDSTLVAVISKSGGTKEPRNGMLTAQAAFTQAGLSFASHFLAVTGVGSELDETAQSEGWLARFPMFDWIGGRTSVMSAVGLVPMALQGLDVESFLKGACAMDGCTRNSDIYKNAALLLALMWHFAGEGQGRKDMVILPYKDRLLLLSRYLQQLVMESLGKERNLQGEVVHQGIAVYGNKGSTDQHAYVQQLREGVNNFFATFIEVCKSTSFPEIEVEKDITSSDYLQGFLRGTRKALYENQRDSITISIDKLDAYTLGALIALYERAVGFYASLIGINAYHQPGVEAGKKAAARILEIQRQVMNYLKSHPRSPLTAKTVSQAVGAELEETFHILVYLASNRPRQIFHQLATLPENDIFSWGPCS